MHAAMTSSASCGARSGARLSGTSGGYQKLKKGLEKEGRKRRQEKRKWEQEKEKLGECFGSLCNRLALFLNRLFFGMLSNRQ